MLDGIDMHRLVAIALASSLLAGCPVAPLISRMTYDGKTEFETWANSTIGKTYEEACIFKGRNILCGPPVESFTLENYTEQVHRQAYQCVFAFEISNDKNIISKWKYVSAPEKCWEYVPTA